MHSQMMFTASFETKGAAILGTMSRIRCSSERDCYIDREQIQNEQYEVSAFGGVVIDCSNSS